MRTRHQHETGHDQAMAGRCIHCGIAPTLWEHNVCIMKPEVIEPEVEDIPEAGEPGFSEAVLDLLEELASDLRAEIMHTYGCTHPDDLHPALIHRYHRDMEPVIRAEKFLRKHGRVSDE